MFSEDMIVIWRWGLSYLVFAIWLVFYVWLNLRLEFNVKKDWHYNAIAIPHGIIIIVGYILVCIFWVFKDI